MVRVKQYTNLAGTKKDAKAKKLERVHKMLEICLPGDKTVVASSPCKKRAADVLDSAQATVEPEEEEDAWGPVEREEEDADARERKWREICDNARRREAEELQKHRQRCQEFKQAVRNLCGALIVAETVLQQHKTRNLVKE